MIECESAQRPSSLGVFGKFAIRGLYHAFSYHSSEGAQFSCTLHADTRSMHPITLVYCPCFRGEQRLDPLVLLSDIEHILSHIWSTYSSNIYMCESRCWKFCNWHCLSLFIQGFCGVTAPLFQNVWSSTDICSCETECHPAASLHPSSISWHRTRFNPASEIFSTATPVWAIPACKSKLAHHFLDFHCNWWIRLK